MSRVPRGETFGPINKVKHWARSHKAYFGAIAPAFPATLGRLIHAMLDQEESNFCTAYGEATSNGYEQGEDFSGEFQTAAEGQYLGSPIINGADPYPSMQATYIMGSLLAALSPFQLAMKGYAFIANPNNWPASLFAQAKQYKTALIPYYVDGPYDIFDNVRSALYQAHQAGEKGVVKAFGFWYESWNQQAMDGLNKGRLRCPSPSEEPVSRHRYTIVDFETEADGTPVLKIVMTQGYDYGDRGIVRMDRETINQVFANSVANGLGLYINRPPQDGWTAFFAWIQSILAYFTARVNLLIKNK